MSERTFLKMVTLVYSFALFYLESVVFPFQYFFVVIYLLLQIVSIKMSVS